MGRLVDGSHGSWVNTGDPLSALLQRALNEIEKCCPKQIIKRCVNKTQLVSFSYAKQSLELKLFGQPIVEQKELTVLGVTFDKKLSFTNHCKSKASKAMQRVRLLRMVSGKKWGANTRTLLKLYKQYIRPVLEYGNVAISKAAKSNLASLQRVQNAALRTALHGTRWSKIADLHEQANIEPVTDRLIRRRCKAIERFGDSELVKSLAIQRALLSDTADTDQ